MSYHFSKTPEVEFYKKLVTRPSGRKKFSQYRGVTSSTNPKKPYSVSFTFKGKKYFVGHFETELEAAQGYNSAVKKILGEFAVLNEIPGDAPES